MTPSANTSGLEVVAWMYGYTHDQTRQLTLFEGQATDKTGWHQPLVTAASAQAEREQYGRWLVAMANDRDAEKARADRLAKALERIGTIPLPEHDKDAWKYVHLAKRLARAAPTGAK